MNPDLVDFVELFIADVVSPDDVVGAVVERDGCPAVSVALVGSSVKFEMLTEVVAVWGAGLAVVVVSETCWDISVTVVWVMPGNDGVGLVTEIVVVISTISDVVRVTVGVPPAEVVAVSVDVDVVTASEVVVSAEVGVVSITVNVVSADVAVVSDIVDVVSAKVIVFSTTVDVDSADIVVVTADKVAVSSTVDVVCARVVEVSTTVDVVSGDIDVVS